MTYDRLEDRTDRPSTVVEEAMLVADLGGAMIGKLAENRGKLHWLDDSVTLTYLFGRLRDEINELEEAAFTLDPEEIWKEAADVANFAAMIAALVEHREAQ